MGEALVALLRGPVSGGDLSCWVGASIGVSLYRADGEGVEVLVAVADQAMYRAKEKGGGRCCFHSEGRGPVEGLDRGEETR